MKQRKRVIMKIAVGLALLLLAGCIAAIINATLAAREPENALPTIRVDNNGTPLPADHIRLASSSWRFLYTVKSDILMEHDTWLDNTTLVPAPVIPGAPLEVHFSYPAEHIKVSRADGDSTTFTECSGELVTPLTPDVVYTYRVEAYGGIRGSRQFYFKIVVRG